MFPVTFSMFSLHHAQLVATPGPLNLGKSVRYQLLVAHRASLWLWLDLLLVRSFGRVRHAHELL